MAPEPLSGADDERLRAEAFAYLRAVQLRTGGPVRYEDAAGFHFRGRRVPLLDRGRGIRVPAGMDAALSIRTVFRTDPARRPYRDEPGPDGYLRYQWRGSDPDHAENRALRAAMRTGAPLIWFQGIASGLYLPVFPVWLVHEEPADHQFVVALDEPEKIVWSAPLDESAADLRRRYALRQVRDRVHQPLFRARVLHAYACRCALCRLGHPELLDAAHIRPDAAGGEPVIHNGIAMCKIHHAAYDSDLLTVRPDYRIEIRPDVLREADGPTLRHSLQGLHQEPIELPTARAHHPDRDLLAERYARFRELATR